MKTVVDHLGRTVAYSHPPKRIISLCPGITETLYALQLENEIVGRTRYCIYPAGHVEKAVKVGGTKEVKLDKIQALQPDLIIAEKEENTKEIVKMLEQEYPVFVAEIQSVDDVDRMIQDMGMLANREKEAALLQQNIQTAFQQLPKVQAKRAAYVIWRKPYMVVGKDTYIQSLLEKMGFVNPFAAYEGRYPAITAEDFKNADLDALFLASEPFPFTEKYFDEFLEMMPDVKPTIVDGEMFWYGPKMLEAVPYFQEKFSSE